MSRREGDDTQDRALPRRDVLRAFGAIGAGLAMAPLACVAAPNEGRNDFLRSAALASGKASRFTILHTSDIHAQLHTHDEFFFENGRAVYRKRGGFGVLKTMVDSLRAENPGNTILIDGGDCFQGGGVAALSQGAALVPLMDRMGYDLVLPGNWEVIYGKEMMLNVVIACGVMGLKIIAEAARIGARVLVIEPIAARRELALSFGAENAISPDRWMDAARDWSGGKGANAVILTIGDPDLVGPCIEACAPGGRVVLFAGFGNRAKAIIDVNRLHYKEISLIGSEWIGTPPNQRRERYDQALDLLRAAPVAWEKLVTAYCGFDDLETALVRRQQFNGLKTVFLTGAN